MTVVAVLLKTESGDDYLFIDDQDNIVSKIRMSMGDEINHVWNREIVSYPHSPDVNAQIRELLYNLED